MKTFIKANSEEYIFYDFKSRWIKRLATTDEIKEFENYEIKQTANKYNL